MAFLDLDELQELLVSDGHNSPVSACGSEEKVIESFVRADAKHF